MTPWAIAWIGWGLYFAIVEGVALANSRSQDTLSEHVWLFLGLRHPRDVTIVPTPDGPAVVPRKQVTGWTKVRRTAVGLFMAALSVHFLIGSDAIGNAVLIGSSTVLAAVVLGTGAVRYWRSLRAKTPKETPHGPNP